MKKLILASLLLAGCTEKLREQQAQALGKYSWDCNSVNIYASRCENHEVICYKMASGISCFWKGK